MVLNHVESLNNFSFFNFRNHLTIISDIKTCYLEICFYEPILEKQSFFLAIFRKFELFI